MDNIHEDTPTSSLQTFILQSTQCIPITTRLETSNRRKQLNQYLRGERVGKGRHGEVYLCQDSHFNNREVAVKAVRRSHPRDKIKLLRRNHQQNEGSQGRDRQFLNSNENSVRKEIAIMKKCRHPNLAVLFEVIDDPREEKIYLVMEYLAGGTVGWATADHLPLLTLAQTRRIMRDVILGIEFLHSKNILHRDIKPSNIMYTADRQSVKLIDFGVAHVIAPPSSKKSSFGPQDSDVDILFPAADLLKRVGTPSFLAPEVVWFSDDSEPCISASCDSFSPSSFQNPSATTVGNYFPMPKVRPPITKAIDIWALGITLHCFLFGRTPFSGSSSGNDNIHHNEFMLYHQICTQDWIADDFMGSERVPTGGRHQKEPTGDGFLVMQMLQGMLQKSPKDRISLSNIKRNPFILCDVSNAREWLRLTTPYPLESSSCWVKSAVRKFLHLLPQRQRVL